MFSLAFRDYTICIVCYPPITIAYIFSVRETNHQIHDDSMIHRGKATPETCFISCSVKWLLYIKTLSFYQSQWSNLSDYNQFWSSPLSEQMVEWIRDSARPVKRTDEYWGVKRRGRNKRREKNSGDGESEERKQRWEKKTWGRRERADEFWFCLLPVCCGLV